MVGDKLRRVKSVKKWLDKAEQSYSSDKEISGEINLIMAQAEMQRLKEVHPYRNVKKWGIRCCSFLAAVLILFGVNTFSDFVKPNNPAVIPGNGQVAKGKAVALKETDNLKIINEIKETPQKVEVVEMSEQVKPVIIEPASISAANSSVPPTISTPVMSQQEIQSVVGEAGRTLRGRS